MTRNQQPPTWLGEECPSWCVVEHAEDDHPDDRYHDSRTIVMPAELLATDLQHVEAGDLSIVESRAVGSAQTVVHISRDGAPVFTLSPEGVAVLVDKLRQTLSESA